MSRKAFAYSRFSTSEQLDGRSLARQEAAAKAYCARHGLTLDERSFTDLGVSAYHGANATHGELAAFLEMVRDGRVPRGSTLIVENMDRISRLPPHEANAVILGLVNAGVDIATTSPEQVYTKKNIHQVATWIPLQVAQCLASEESQKKSDRLADAWGDKRSRAASHKLTKKGPAWLTLTPDRAGWVVREDKARRVRQIFRWAAEGLGAAQIAGRLNRECPEGLTGKGWQPSFICSLLRSRSVLGEYQPHVGTCAKKGRKSTRRPVGEPVKDYFPAILTENEFYAAQRALDGRRSGGGRVTGTPNLFNGILWDAADGRKMVLNASHGRRVLVSSGAVRKLEGSAFRAVGYDVFEEAILGRLEELTPADVTGRADPGQDEVQSLSGELTALNGKIAQAQARAAKADDPTVFLDLLEELARQRKGVIARREKALAEAANREGDNLGDAQSLIGMLRDAAPEEREGLRRRVKAALRRLVDKIMVLVVPSGPARTVAVQLWFADKKSRRDYLIVCRRGRKGRPAGPPDVYSLADVAEPGDLRDPAQAAGLAELLAALPAAALGQPGPA